MMKDGANSPAGRIPSGVGMNGGMVSQGNISSQNQMQMQQQ